VAAAFIAFHLACTLAMVALLASTPEPAGQWAVIFPPWYDAKQVLSAIVTADGRLVRFGGAPWIAVIAPSPRHLTLKRQLGAQGALAFINPIIVGGCDTAVPQTLPAR
jgi:hypothetical protein